MATINKPIAGVTMPSFQFFHGLGDCANAAHLFALYRKLGHDLAIHCTPDKAVLFKAAGCEVVTSSSRVHPWSHPPGAGHPGMSDHYTGNKTAWNVSRDGLPNIGSYADRWGDLCAVKLDLEVFTGDAVRLRVAQFISTLPRPIICLHTKGNTSQGNKNYPDELTMDLYRQLLDRMDGSLLLLDWDNRVPRLPHGRVRHLADDWRTLDLLELYEVLQQSDLLLGVDSGVLHFSRFTNTPAVGIWTHHYPAFFALPRRNTVHVVSRKHEVWNRRRRFAYNLVESPGAIPQPSVVADTAAVVLGKRKWLADPGPDTVLHKLFERSRSVDQGHHPYCDRNKTMGAFLDLLKCKTNPLVVETGCVRSEDDWGAGWSSPLIGYFLKYHGGELHSIDCDQGNVGFARTWTTGLPVTVHHSDSRTWLQSYSGRPIDGLYLDSADVGTTGYQEICLEEVKTAVPKLASYAPVLIDDSPWTAGAFKGKGGLAIPWLLKQGYKVKQAGYQVLLRKEVPAL
jgi:hypothetical protein